MQVSSAETQATRFCIDLCNTFRLHQKFSIEVETLFKSNLLSNDCEPTTFKYWSNEKLFPHLHRKSIYISVIGELEFALSELCTLCKSDFEVEGIPKDYERDNGIARYFKYLSNNVGVSGKDTLQHFDYFRKCAKLRNFLVHNGGQLDAGRSREIGAWIKTQEGLSLSEFREILIKSKFIEDFLAKIRSLFILLHTDLKQLYVPDIVEYDQI